MKPEDARLGQYVHVQFTGTIREISEGCVAVTVAHGAVFGIRWEAVEPLTKHGEGLSDSKEKVKIPPQQRSLPHTALYHD